MKPLVGIASVYKNPAPESVWDRFHENFVNEAYTCQLYKSGAVPVILPCLKNPDENDIEELLSPLSALLVPGGADFNPSCYGERKLECTDEPEDIMDSFQLEIIKTAHRMGKWVFGVCRGMQGVNIAFGGKLYQDVAQEYGKSLVHMRKDSPYSPVHSVELKKDSLLYKIFGCGKISVNSLHHQGVKILGENLEATAFADDGLVEGIEGDRILAVQWHPEALDSPFFERIVSFLK